MKELECPNCGAPDPKVLSEGEYECNACGTRFVNEALLQRKRAAEKQAAKRLAEEKRQQAKIQLEQARTSRGMGRGVFLFIAIVLIIIFGVIFYMGTKSMEESRKSQEEMIKGFRPVGQ